MNVHFDITELLPGLPNAEDACARRLVGSLKGRAGIRRVHLAEEGSARRVCVHYAEEHISAARITEIARTLAAQLARCIGHVRWHLTGRLSPPLLDEAARLLRSRAGVLEAHVEGARHLCAEYLRDRTSAGVLGEALGKVGISARAAEMGAAPEEVVPEKAMPAEAETPAPEDQGTEASEAEAPTHHAATRPDEASSRAEEQENAMTHVTSDSAHGIVSACVSGHPAPEALGEMTLELEEALAWHHAPGLLLQLEHFCTRHAGDALAEALFKLLAVDLTRDYETTRIAVVGAPSWEDWATGVLRPLTAAEVRYFEASEVRAAWRWLHAETHG